jgi:hypothetical protein
MQSMMDAYVIPRAKTIHVQQLAPDISQNHVIKLLKENIWQFKQVFSHFGIQSLTEVRCQLLGGHWRPLIKRHEHVGCRLTAKCGLT